MQNFFRNKTTILVGIAIVIVVGVYYAFFRGDATPTGVNELVTEVGASPSSAILGRGILNTLSELKSIRLDESVFSDPAFRSLSDFTVPIERQPVGRRNPFAPVGGDVGTRPSPTSPKPPNR